MENLLKRKLIVWSINRTANWLNSQLTERSNRRSIDWIENLLNRKLIVRSTDRTVNWLNGQLIEWRIYWTENWLYGQLIEQSSDTCIVMCISSIYKGATGQFSALRRLADGDLMKLHEAVRHLFYDVVRFVQLLKYALLNTNQNICSSSLFNIRDPDISHKFVASGMQTWVGKTFSGAPSMMTIQMKSII